MSANPSSSGGGGSSSGGGGGSGGGPCGACKFLRRKCVAGCIFAPYFDSEQGAAHFAAVHKVFGASNVSKLLLHIPVHRRLDAVVTICYEAQARLRDPVYGCVAHIFALQQQVANLQAELSYLQAHLATLEVPTPPPPPPQPFLQPPPLSIADLPRRPPCQQHTTYRRSLTQWCNKHGRCSLGRWTRVYLGLTEGRLTDVCPPWAAAIYMHWHGSSWIDMDRHLLVT